MKIKEEQNKIKKLIRERSPFSQAETERILDKFFSHVPADIKILAERYSFDRKKVLDVGCGYGRSLLYWGKESEGIEILDKMIEFLKCLDVVAYKIDMEQDIAILGDKKYDAIYSNNLLEHMDSPYNFLVKLRSLLKPCGILAIGHPVVPCFRTLWEKIGYKGWLAKEHINFFTPITAKLTIERAGLKVVEQYFSGLSKINLNLSKFCVPFGVHVLHICQKADLHERQR